MKITKQLILALSFFSFSPAFAQTQKFYAPFVYESLCALETKDEYLFDNCKVVETREKGGALRTRNIYSNRFGLTIKGRFVKDKGYMTWDSHNKYEYKWEYKVDGVDGLGTWSVVMPGFLVQNISWD
jgi:hypothetical protein